LTRRWCRPWTISRDSFRFSGTFSCLGQIRQTAPPSASDIDNPVELVWGGPLPRDPGAFERRFGLTLIGCYGLTDAGDPAFADPEDPDRWASCGSVLPEYTVRIADPDRESVPAGTVGEILIRSEIPGITSAGYYKHPQATVGAWRDLWFHSGDLGYLDEDGKLYFLGRIKEIIPAQGRERLRVRGRGSARASSRPLQRPRP
jgi:crotonobetaine/carnitine-CoA ligase